MNEYAKTEKGFHFVLTNEGKQIGRISAKFEKEYSNYNQYQHCVPASWLSKGYVKIEEEKDE